MVQNKLFCTYLMWIGLMSFGLQAQERLLLDKLIPILETRYDIKFSFTEKDISGILVETPKTTDSLEDVVEGLNNQTLLNFKFLDERYITISTINKNIKVCGTLVSAITKDSIFGASVYVEGTSKGVITNEAGFFELNEVNVTQNIVISYIGFKSLKLKADNLWAGNNCKTIVLEEQTQQLNEILILKFLTTGLQQRVDGSSVLNTEKFGILPGLTEPDVLQTIQALPGVESVDESIATINVRGGTNDQNLILWDHIKMYHSGHFFGLISAYNPYLTNRVVVTKNGTSSEFSDGVSSTVSMFTKNMVKEEFSGSVGANLIHADAFLEISIKENLALHVSGRRSFTDFLSSPTYEKYFDRSFQDSEITTNGDNISESNRDSEFFFYDFTAKLLWDIGKRHKVRANIIGIHNNLDYRESFMANNDETESKTSNLEQESIGAGLNWNANWSAKFNTNVNLFYSQYDVDAVDYRIQTDQRLTQVNEVLETGLKLKTDYILNDQINLMAGYQFSEIGILNETTVTNPDYDRTRKHVLLNHAIFAETEYNRKKTYIRIGVRGNYFQKFNQLLIEPRINVRQKVFSALALKLQGEFKNQSATQIVDFQDDFLGVENRRWILSNKESDIPIAQSKQGSFGLQFNKNNWLLDIDGFYKIVDGITASNQGFYNNFQYLNATGSYTVKGIEFLLNKTASNYSTWLSYTYSLNDYEFKQFVPSQFPNNVDIRHSVSTAFNYDVTNNFKISLGGNWRSGKPYTKPVEGNETMQNGSFTVVNYDSPNRENLDYFMRLDTSASYQFKLSEQTHAVLRAGVLNILDRENIIHRYYEVDPNDSNATVEINNKSLGLTPNVSFRINF